VHDPFDDGGGDGLLELEETYKLCFLDDENGEMTITLLVLGGK
jgi:hypothetical protein